MGKPAAKRLKLESGKSQELKGDTVDDQPGELKRKSRPSLESLNDDCCLTIFEMLPLNDLCSMSKTCTRFQDLSKDVYRRRYKSRLLIVKNITSKNKVAVGPDENDIKYFAKYIQNVSLGKEMASKTALEGLKHFYRTNGVPIETPIKTLRFESWNSGLSQIHGPVLADIVQGVEAVTLANTKVVGDLYKNLLQFLPNMKSLTLWQNLTEADGGTVVWMDDEKFNWMEQIYPKLEHFAWHLKNEVPVEKLKQFIQANPNMRTFSLLSESQKTLNDLLFEDIGIDELFFDMPVDIAGAIVKLRLLCEMGKRTKLHLKFADSVRPTLKQSLHQLTELAPYIVGLYFEDECVDDDLVKEIVKFENLKMIQLNIPQYKDTKWLTTIPSLEAIFIYRAVSAWSFSSYHSALLLWTGQMANLKKIYIRNNSQKFDHFGLGSKCDAARRKLADAHKLKIYFKSDEPKCTGRLKNAKCKFDKIEALRVETENFDNPLATKYLTAIKFKGTSHYRGKYSRRHHRYDYYSDSEDEFDYDSDYDSD